MIISQCPTDTRRERERDKHVISTSPCVVNHSINYNVSYILNTDLLSVAIGDQNEYFNCVKSMKMLQIFFRRKIHYNYRSERYLFNAHKFSTNLQYENVY